MSQQALDAKNAEFWNELCGSGLARSLGVHTVSPENLDKFDSAYMALYPYLREYVSREDLRQKKVLEIGLGYGTLGQLLASCDCHYHGLDVADGPVAMMRYRLGLLGRNGKDAVQVGSALQIPHAASTFDYVYSIGCLHHTGDVKKAVSELHRVLVPGGKAVVMLYNRHSFRRIVAVPLKRLRSLVSRDQRSFAERVRAMYDENVQGEAAPHTDFVSRAEAARLFMDFSRARIESQNFDSYTFFKGRLVIPRERLINNIGRILGLDLYIEATK
jgi:SAM-dependent methyltransferase